MLKFRKGELRSGCGIWIFESETPKKTALRCCEWRWKAPELSSPE